MISVSRLFTAGCVLAVGALSSNFAIATPIIGVATSVASPQPLGTSVSITGTATDSDAGTISYRFQVGLVVGKTLTLVRDFSVDNTFVYTPTVHEGKYKFVVTARNNTTGNAATGSVSTFTFSSLVTGSAPAIHPTANPLVALFSSPPCSSGGTSMRVSVIEAGSTSPFYTSSQACTAGLNLNFLIAGMRPKTLYYIGSKTLVGSTTVSGPKVEFVTGTPSIVFPTMTVVRPLTSADDQTQRFILMSPLATTGFVFGVDLSTTPIWYYQDAKGTPLVTRPLQGGDIIMLANGQNSAGTGSTLGSFQILRKIDIGGNTVHETNASRVAEQVAAMSGITSTCQLGGTDCLIGAFSHDAMQLPNGHTLALAAEEKLFTDGTQGSSPSNPVDLIGDIIVDLDENLQLVYYWRSFDHMNANRAAILGETCAPNQGGCPPVTLTTGLAQDWLHGNAIQYEPTDGSIIYSSRHQDWILKIDYGNGNGTNDTLWTLGKGGDFTINSNDPYPWFSHQHDPGFVQSGTTISATQIAMFDNGNTRVQPAPLGLGSGDSRGYVLDLDPVNKVATPVLMADLGFFSVALGSAELLQNGDWQFDAGWTPTAPPFNAQTIEVFPNAALSYTFQLNGGTNYRSFRMSNLYTPPLKD